MRKYFILVIVVFILLRQFKVATEAIDESKELSLDLNNSRIAAYEKRIKDKLFKSKQEEEIYREGYLGFLIWISNNEYPEYDEEYKENINVDLSL